MTSKKTSRNTSALLIVSLFLSCFTAICAVLVPLICSQFTNLAQAIPGYIQSFLDIFYPKIIELGSRFGFNLEPDLAHMLSNQEMATKFVDFSRNLFDSAFNSSLAIVNVLSLIFITPVLIFYMVRDWDILIANISKYVPHTASSVLGKISKEINQTLSGYVRGQFNVCLILGIIYSVFLSLSGLNFGFLIGFLTGFFSFIPFIGMICGVTTAIVISLFQFGFDLTQIGIISAIFLFGQILESNYLTPKLIGSKIGLHPVWIIFGLFFFGAIFGFFGILFAVPLSAICGVIAKHLIAKLPRIS
jgi:predicted PurR-regulated permease PerM